MFEYISLILRNSSRSFYLEKGTLALPFGKNPKNLREFSEENKENKLKIQVMKKNLLLFTLLGALVTGCMTAQYHEKDYQGNGYSEYRMNTDTFAVTYRGDPHTDPEDVRKFALKRAAEVTSNYGYRYFIIEGERDLTKTSLVTSKNEEISFVEDFWTHSLKPIKNVTEKVTEKKNYAIELTIRCYTKEPKEEERIDAYQFLAYTSSSPKTQEISKSAL